MTLEEMLREAREYAALAEKATPGPWAAAHDMARLLAEMAEVLKEVKAAVEDMDVWKKVEQKPYNPDAIPQYECFFCGKEIYTGHEDYCPRGRLVRALTRGEASDGKQER